MDNTEIIRSRPGPLLRNHDLGGEQVSKGGPQFWCKIYFSLRTPYESLYYLEGINYGKRPITTIVPLIFVIRTRRGCMDGPGSEKHGPFAK